MPQFIMDPELPKTPADLEAEHQKRLADIERASAERQAEIDTRYARDLAAIDEKSKTASRKFNLIMAAVVVVVLATIGGATALVESFKAECARRSCPTGTGSPVVLDNQCLCVQVAR